MNVNPNILTGNQRNTSTKKSISLSRSINKWEVPAWTHDNQSYEDKNWILLRNREFQRIDRLNSWEKSSSEL